MTTAGKVILAILALAFVFGMYKAIMGIPDPQVRGMVIGIWVAFIFVMTNR